LGQQYIALERLEAIYKSCKLVHNICVYAATQGKQQQQRQQRQRQQPLAIVIPHPQLLRNYLAKRGGGGRSSNLNNSNHELATLCDDRNIKEIIKKECNVIGRKNGFRQSELLQAVVLTPEEWTPENGLVTAGGMQQIRRERIVEAFKSQIEVSTFDIYLQLNIHIPLLQEIYKSSREM